MASTHILAVGKIVRDGIEMDVSMPPWLDPHESIELPPCIDEAAELEEYQDWIADQDYHRSGNW